MSKELSQSQSQSKERIDSQIVPDSELDSDENGVSRDEFVPNELSRVPDAQNCQHENPSAKFDTSGK